MKSQNAAQNTPCYFAVASIRPDTPHKYGSVFVRGCFGIYQLLLIITREVKNRRQAFNLKFVLFGWKGSPKFGFAKPPETSASHGKDGHTNWTAK
jgi:hypothetical protein